MQCPLALRFGDYQRSGSGGRRNSSPELEIARLARLILLPYGGMNEQAVPNKAAAELVRAWALGYVFLLGFLGGKK